MPDRATRRRQRLANRLHSAAIHLLRRARRADAESGLSPARLSALSVLVFGGRCTLSDLARAEQVKPPTMSRLVSALEADGLVRRRADPDDGRALRLEATDAGQRLLEAARDRRVTVLVDLLDGVDSEGLGVLEGAADILERVMSDE